MTPLKVTGYPDPHTPLTNATQLSAIASLVDEIDWEGSDVKKISLGRALLALVRQYTYEILASSLADGRSKLLKDTCRTSKNLNKCYQDVARYINTGHEDLKRGTPHYSLASRLWSMRNRVTQPKNPSYPDYGGRGIKMEAEWMRGGQEGYRKFFLDIGTPPDDDYGSFSIDRIDCNGNYTADNVRWVKAPTQGQNRRGVHHISRSDGSQVPLTQEARDRGISPKTAADRRRKGKSNKEIFSNQMGGKPQEQAEARHRVIDDLVKSGRIKVFPCGRIIDVVANKPLYPYVNKEGYWCVKLPIAKTAGNSSCPRNDTFRAHQVVAVAIHGVPESGMVPHHCDGNKLNNRPSNLQWVPHKVNAQKRFETPSKLVEDYREKATYTSLLESRLNLRPESNRYTDEAPPKNVAAHEIEQLLTIVKDHPNFPTSFLKDFPALLREILSASQNEPKLTHGGVTILVHRGTEETPRRILLPELKKMDRAYVGCPTCGYQQKPFRLLIRDRTRGDKPISGEAVCDPCNSLKRKFPELDARRIPAPDGKGYRNGLNIPAMSHDAREYFRCYRCEQRIHHPCKVKNLVHTKRLPICAHCNALSRSARSAKKPVT